MNPITKKILVAEDEDNLRGMLVMVLEDEDYQVDSAVDGKEAWALINKNEYDILITDLFMPEMNGFDLIEKSQALFLGMKTILVSGGGKDLDATSGNNTVVYKHKKIIVSAYLTKPYSLSELLSIIDEF